MKKRVILLSSLCLLTTFLICFYFFCEVEAPNIFASTVPNLRDAYDPYLQLALDRAVLRLGLGALVQAQKAGIALVDVTDENQPRMALINGDSMIYAASLPKIAVLLTAFEKVKAGELNDTLELRQMLTEMIRFSSNDQASRVISLVSFQSIAQVLQAPRYLLYDSKRNGGLWVGKAYGKNDYWKRDPISGLSHAATAFQVARFYYLMVQHELVSPQITQDIRNILSNPGLQHKFVAGLKVRPGSVIYRKSGTWNRWHADSALVERSGKRYIAVGLLEDPNGELHLRQLILAMDDIIHYKNNKSKSTGDIIYSAPRLN